MKHDVENDSTRALRKALASGESRNKNLKDLGDVMGLPSEEDKERIRRMILRYEKKHPGFIQQARDEAKEQYAAVGGMKQKYGLVNKAAHGRVLFELPEELLNWIDRAYPLMFRSKTQLRWFVKHFPELLVPEKY